MEPIALEAQTSLQSSRPNEAALVLRLSFLIGLAGLYALAYQAVGTGEILGQVSRNRLLGMLPVAVLALTALAGGSSGRIAGWMQSRVQGFLKTPAQASRAAAVAFWLLWLVFPLLTFSPLGETVFKVFPRIWIFAHLVLLGGIFWYRARPGRNLLGSLAVSTLAYTGLYKAAAFFPEVQTYPFSLGWSEASRFYYASLFRSQALYGTSLPLPTLHPSRYLLQSIPFLIPSLPLWFHRLWQVLLWLGCTIGLAAVLLRRLQLTLPSRRILFVAWASLFLFQGPVYYHLALCAVPVLWGMNSKKPWRSLIWVLLASLWAGISRVNWIPLPGSLAALFYLMEVSLPGRFWLRYLLPPAAYLAAGSAAGLLSQMGYTAISGNPAGLFNSSFTSSLLWYRLFPSATYPLGILPGAFLASAALAAVLYLRWRSVKGQIHFIRVLGIVAILSVFLLGGLVVSVKIGGGSNLHNLDAFLVLLLVAASVAWTGALVPDTGSPISTMRLSPVLLALALIIPALPVTQTGSPISLPSISRAQADLAVLQEYLDTPRQSSGEVLFITERHLIPFRYVKGVRMAADYEKVFLMEMVMAGNQPYLEKFWNDLQNHQFALIITEPVSATLQDRSHAFGEENNVWVEGVSIPLLESYKKIGELEGSGVWIMAPR